MESQFRMELKPFPIDAMPKWMREFVSAVAANVQVSPDMVAVPLLSTLCIPLQSRFIVRIDSTYTEPLCLYTLTIARPSERKSAIIRILEKPLWDFQQEANAAMQEMQAAKEAEEMEKPPWLRKQGKSKKPEIKPLTLYVTDSTPEKLARLMTENNGAIALISDEPDALAVAAGLRYGKSRNLGLMLQAWSAGRVMIQRATEDQRIAIDRAVMSVAVMSQPSFVEALMKDGEMSNRGFMQRFLYAKPLSQVGNRTFEKPEIKQYLLDEYNYLMTDFLKMSADHLRELRISEEAKELASELFNAVEEEIGKEKVLEGWMGKLFGQLMRIAGVLHCVKWGVEAESHEIELETMELTAALGDYFISHAKAVFTDIDKPESVEDARELYRRMKESGRESFTKSDLYALTSRKMPQARLEAALAELMHSQHVDIIKFDDDAKQWLYALLGDERGLDESEVM